MFFGQRGAVALVLHSRSASAVPALRWRGVSMGLVPRQYCTCAARVLPHGPRFHGLAFRGCCSRTAR
eukprot:127834-Lingulodinium_polyedra.AAC.1